ncbi:MAG: hypothetical protein Kow0029_22910 [Candidatus Rifleibacteriota bacterium]
METIYIFNKRRILTGFLVAAAMIAILMLQGCLSSSKSRLNYGMLTGELPMMPNANLLVVGDNSEVKIKLDSEGKFAAQLEPGRYQLLAQGDDGKLVVIKRDILIENNLTFTVTDVDLIPIPAVTSVSVPLVYNTSAIIEWETDIESDGFIEYGTNELYGFSSYADTELKTSHRVQLFDLQPNTTYHFRISASRYNLDSSRSYSRDYAFTTEP